VRESEAACEAACEVLEGWVTSRDYRGCIRMYPDKYPRMVDKLSWIWIISTDIHIIHTIIKWAVCQMVIVVYTIDVYLLVYS
jgi:hypothetical protein